MTDQTTTEQLPEDAQAFVERLAEFRNRQPEDRQQIIDTIVHRACEGPEADEASAPSSDQAQLPSESDVEALVKEIDAFRAGLDHDQQEALDKLLTAGSREDAEVEGQEWKKLWSHWAPTGMYNYYFGKCYNEHGTSNYSSIGTFMSTFTCWRWS